MGRHEFGAIPGMLAFQPWDCLANYSGLRRHGDIELNARMIRGETPFIVQRINDGIPYWCRLMVQSTEEL
jgi:hypothetical protein